MNKKTTAVKLETLEQGWVFVDAKDQILGRVATEIAKALMGKDKPTFSYNANVGDKVVVTNAEKIVVTGKKLTDKKYQWYTGFPGGLRTQSLQDKLDKNPTQVIQSAVKGMLPKNRLQKIRMANLYIYAGAENPHTAQMNAGKGKKK